MKKPNKKANAIKHRKALKRNAVAKRKAKQKAEALNAKKNIRENFAQEMQKKYLDMIAKSFDATQK